MEPGVSGSSRFFVWARFLHSQSGMRQQSGTKIDGVADVDLPREKLERVGADALKSEELLAILLRTGYEGRNVLTLARRVLERHSCGRLVRMSLADLVEIKGIGRAKASVLVAAFELARRAFGTDVGIAPTINSPRDVLPIIADIKDHRKEHFLALFLNGRNQVIRREDVSVGSLSQTLVQTRGVENAGQGWRWLEVVMWLHQTR